MDQETIPQNQVQPQAPQKKSMSTLKIVLIVVGSVVLTLIIIAVALGLLASASLSSARDAAADAQLQANMQQVRNAVEFHYNNFGVYPLSLEELQKSNFLPANLNELEYSLIENGSNFQICAEFEKKERDCIQGLGI